MARKKYPSLQDFLDEAFGRKQAAAPEATEEEILAGHARARQIFKLVEQRRRMVAQQESQTTH